MQWEVQGHGLTNLIGDGLDGRDVGLAGAAVTAVYAVDAHEHVGTAGVFGTVGEDTSGLGIRMWIGTPRLGLVPVGRQRIVWGYQRRCTRMRGVVYHERQQRQPST